MVKKWLKKGKMTHIYDFIRQKRDMVWKKNFRKCLSDPPTKQLQPWSKFHRAQNCKKVSKSGIFLHFLHKSPIYRPYHNTWLTTPLNLTKHEQTKVFLSLQTHMLITIPSYSPLDFFKNKMVDRSHFLLLVNVTV